MSESESNSKAPPPRSVIFGILTVVVAGLVVSFTALQWMKRDRESQLGVSERLTEFNKAVEAIAASEDQDYQRGLKLWRELASTNPSQPAFRVNQAVTVLKWIDDVNNELSSGDVEPAREEELNNGLAMAIDEAGQIINSLEELGTEVDPARVALLKAGLLEGQAQPLGYEEKTPLLTEAAEVLAEVLRQDPGQPLLAAKYDLLASPLIEEPEDPRWKLIAEAYYASWKSEPRNMFLMARANEALFRIQDKRLLDLFEPSWEVSKPMQSMVGRQIKSLKPEQTMESARASIESGDWRKAIRIKMWYNLLTGMSGFNPDARRVNPDMMALLDTRFLNEMAEKLPPDDKEESPVFPRFEYQALDGQVQAMRWFDFDLDLDFELLIARGQQLLLYEIENGQLAKEPSQTLELGFEPEGMLIGEFFKVDDPQRNRVPKSVAELMARSGPETREAGTTPEYPNRHDTFQEVVLWNSASLEPPVFVTIAADSEQALSLERATEDTLIQVGGVQAAEVIDIESDGDLDLLLSTGDSLRVLRNNGNRTFEEITEFSDLVPLGLSEANSLTDFAVADFDGDLDQDVVCLVAGKNQPVLLENVLHGQFRARPLEDEAWQGVSDGVSLAVADMDGNGCWDLVIGSSSESRVRFGRQLAPGEVKGLADVSLAAGIVVQPGDFNNDGRQDVLTVGSGVKLELGDSKLGFTNTSLEIPGDYRMADVIDANQDGALDFVVSNGQSVQVAWGQPNPEAGYLIVRVRGQDDGNGGGRNNHFAIGSTLEVWSEGRQIRQIVRQPVTHFGLGDREADNLRIVFANGLTQNVEKPEAGILIEERQELKGSCPFVYGGNGERFELITDLLWNAPLGLQVARGQTLPDRRWENLVLPGELVQPKDGYYELQVTEELWEVAYFDHIQLSAIDHPESTRLFSNEKVGPPQIAEHRLFTPRDIVFPRSATDSKGRDQRDHLKQVDGQYAQGFDRLICQGLAEPHFVELDFGDIPTGVDARLFMTGWMHPTDTSLNIGISQNEDRSAPEPPSLWVLDEAGEWVCALPFTGFPGGKPKSIVIDLNGVFRSADQRIRLASSQQIYWDEAFVSWNHAPEVARRKLEMVDADLHYRGFGELMPRSQDEPHRYDYQKVSTEEKWPPLAGPFTRYGDVGSILAQDEDRMVVLDSGDEVTLRFKVPEDPIPAGWRRDFVLRSAGWDKDADLNTLAGQGSLPLPYSDQQHYPADANDPEVAEVLRKNLPTLTREPNFISPVIDSSSSIR